MTALSKRDFHNEVNEIAALLAASDGIHHFLGGELKTFFAKDKEFRAFVKKHTPPGDEPELIRATHYLMDNRDNTDILLKAREELAVPVKHIQEAKETHAQMHTRKAIEALLIRQEYLSEADRRIAFLMEKSQTEGNRKEKREKIKKSIRAGMSEDHAKNASLRYLSNNFGAPRDTGRILQAMKESMNCSVPPEHIEAIRKEHFPSLKLSPANKKTGKPRR